jgi:hypothetical protein
MHTNSKTLKAKCFASHARIYNSSFQQQYTKLGDIIGKKPSYVEPEQCPTYYTVGKPQT